MSRSRVHMWEFRSSLSMSNEDKQLAFAGLILDQCRDTNTFTFFVDYTAEISGYLWSKNCFFFFCYLLLSSACSKNVVGPKYFILQVCLISFADILGYQAAPAWPNNTLLQGCSQFYLWNYLFHVYWFWAAHIVGQTNGELLIIFKSSQTFSYHCTPYISVTWKRKPFQIQTVAGLDLTFLVLNVIIILKSASEIQLQYNLSSRGLEKVCTRNVFLRL